MDEGIGSKWVHIGDDFTEDIVAAKADLKLRTIWYHTAERKAKKQAEEEEARRKAKSSLDKEELKKDEGGDGGGGRYFQDKVAIQVTGTETDDYLAHFIVKEFVDAEVESIGEIEGVIQAWIDECSMDEKALAASAIDAAASSSSTLGGKADGDKGGVGEKATTKFCIACGEKLPVRAKFCSACGEPQG